MLVQMAGSAQMGTLRRVISWIEIGLGLLLAVSLAVFLYSISQAEPSDRINYGNLGLFLFGTLMVGGVGIGLVFGGLGLRSQRPLVQWLAHIPLSVSLFNPWLLFHTVGAVMQSFESLTR